MRRFGRLLSLGLGALAMAGAVAEGAGAHDHALQETDLAAHSLMVVERTVDCGTPAHLDTAVPHRHGACGSCTLASTPTGTPPPDPAVAAAPASGSPLLAVSTSPHGAVRDRRGPARAPPLPAPLDA
jgi:hypothetical protein